MNYKLIVSPMTKTYKTSEPLYLKKNDKKIYTKGS